MDKIIDIEERIPTLRERRKKRTNRKFFLLIFIFLFTLTGLLYFQSDFSHISRIHVDGASLNSNEAYIEKSGLENGMSMWGFRAGAIEKTLMSSNEVKEATVKRGWINEISISIKEWDRLAFIEKDGEYMHLLENGTTFPQKQKDMILDAPILSGFSEQHILKRMTKELQDMPSDILPLISQIRYTPNKQDQFSLQIFMNDGNEVRALIPSLSEKMKYYPSIVTQIPTGQYGVIDLEVGSFFSPYQEVYGPDLPDEDLVEGEEAEVNEEQQENEE
ncbi:cell division protein FtsQ/DivIB [Chungangia koreensis]|uniref:Cell division protein DivIB n=1 Tax=Chungangia koreensis TaxID=752657 RepID=A0ABV8X2Q5_9LACT